MRAIPGAKIPAATKIRMYGEKSSANGRKNIATTHRLITLVMIEIKTPEWEFEKFKPRFIKTEESAYIIADITARSSGKKCMHWWEKQGIYSFLENFQIFIKKGPIH